MFGAILPAGGLGKRMGVGLPKQMLDIGGLPVWRRTLDAFLQHPQISEIVLVHPAEWEDHFVTGIQGLFTSTGQPVRLTVGGAERWQSVRNGVLALPKQVTYALAHDVARPFVARQILDDVLQQVVHGACLVAKPATDTVKVVSKGIVINTIDRSTVWLAQTPQAFAVDTMKELYDRLGDTPGWDPTDEASILEFYGVPVSIVPGNDQNDKLTTPSDLVRFRCMVEQLSESPV